MWKNRRESRAPTLLGTASVFSRRQKSRVQCRWPGGQPRSRGTNCQVSASATLYRHFPTREALFRGGASSTKWQHLADLAERLKQRAQPIEALRQWMRSNVKFVATKKGMSAALALAAYKNSELFSYSFDRPDTGRRRVAGPCGSRASATSARTSPRKISDVLQESATVCYMHDRRLAGRLIALQPADLPSIGDIRFAQLCSQAKAEKIAAMRATLGGWPQNGECRGAIAGKPADWALLSKPRPSAPFKMPA